MIIDDEYIVSKFFKNGKINIGINKNLTEEIKNYLDNRFNDYSESYREILLRIYHKIEVRPVCPICGDNLRFIGKYNRFYSKTCCKKECINEQSVKQNRNTCLEKYGVLNAGGLPQTIEKIKHTKFINHGNPNYVNIEKQKETFSKRTDEQNRITKEKRINTCKEKYGCDYAFQSDIVKEKIANTLLNKYGVKYAAQSPEVIEKIKNSLHKYYENLGCYDYKEKPPGILEQYGVTNVFQLPYVKDKIKKTKFEKYGDENYVNIEKAKKTKLERYGDEYYYDKEKLKNTCKEKYGCEHTFQSNIVKEKINKTCLERYGVKNWASSDEFKNLISEILSTPEAQQKRYETCKHNNSFNKSQPEEDCYELLKSVYDDVMRQYRDERYPFNCDFYIPSLDLFIEFNGSQYHYRRPYLGTEEDIKEANELLEKDKKLCEERGCDHTQYKNIWHCWTIRDPKKRQIAKDNKLNFIEFWNLKEVEDWLNHNN